MLEYCLPVPGLWCQWVFCCEQFTCHACAAAAVSFALGLAPTLQSGLKLPLASTLQGLGVTEGLFSKTHLQTEALMDEASKADRHFEGAAL